MFNDAIDHISEFVKERREQAKGRFEAQSRRHLEEMLKRGRSHGEDAQRKLEDALEALKDLKDVDVRKQVESLRAEVLEVFHLAPREDVERLEAEVARLRADLARTRSARKVKTAPKTTRPSKASPPRPQAPARKPAAGPAAEPPHEG